MDFSRRLRLFIFGVLLGCLVVWALLATRGHSLPAWTPKGRILETLQKHPVTVLPEARCRMDCNGISDNDMLHVINTADVLFSESDIRGKEIPEYVIEGKGLNNRQYKLKFRSEAGQNYLLTVIPTPNAPDTCTCK